MEYAIIIAVVVVIAVGVFIYMKKNKKNSTTPTIEETRLTSRATDLIVSDTKKDELIIPIEMLPAEIIPDEKALSEAQNWFMYQKSLADVLYKISDLRYALHLGAVSREQCTALLPAYAKQVSYTQERLTGWHVKNTKRLGIDTEEIRRKRTGFDGVIHFLPGLFNDDFNFRSIKKGTAKMIAAQASGHGDIHLPDESELYGEDVQLIAKNGKIYYFPNTDTASSEEANKQ